MRFRRVKEREKSVFTITLASNTIFRNKKSYYVTVQTMVSEFLSHI